MSSYLFVALVLWLLSIRNTLAELIVGVTLVWFVCALRYETGFDWMVYESYFQGVASGACFTPPRCGCNGGTLLPAQLFRFPVR